MAFGIESQKAARVCESFVMPNTGEDVEGLASSWQCVEYPIGREQRQSQFSCNPNGSLVARFLFATQMPLQFHVYILAAKQIAQLPHTGDSVFNASLRQSMRQWPFRAPGQANEAVCSFGDLRN